MQIAGSHALVTGGSSGIGLATARLLLARGARVSILARDQQRLDRAVASLGAPEQVAAVSADVADPEAVDAALAAVTTRFGPADILVASAGQTAPQHFLDLPDEIFRRLMEVDYFGTLHPIRAIVPGMVDRGRGSIVAISSGAALLGVYGYSAYAPAKFAVRGLMECLRDELTPYGIHVACVYPPDVDTPMLAAENVDKPAETHAIGGTVKPLSADQVARSIVRAIERGTFAVYPNTAMAALAGLGPVAGPVVRRVKDHLIRRNRSR